MDAHPAGSGVWMGRRNKSHCGRVSRHHGAHHDLHGPFCRHHRPPAPAPASGGCCCVEGGSKQGSNLIGARGPLATAVGLMLQGSQVTTSTPTHKPVSFTALKPNPTEQTEGWAASSQHPVGFLETRPGSAGRAQQRAAPRTRDKADSSKGPGKPACAGWCMKVWEGS